jgi:hypothetical protein
VANVSTAAAVVAGEHMERLKGTPYNALVAGGDLENDVAGYFETVDLGPGLGQIRTRWTIAAAPGLGSAYFITVRSEGLGALAGQRSRSEFRVFRACTVCGCNAADVCSDVTPP